MAEITEYDRDVAEKMLQEVDNECDYDDNLFSTFLITAIAQILADEREKWIQPIRERIAVLLKRLISQVPRETAEILEHTVKKIEEM